MAVKASKSSKVGYGLRERLLVSFIAISAFAVAAAVVGNYAFYAIGEALHQVTEKSVPPAIATLELAQRAERIVAAGPALLAASDNAEFARYCVSEVRNISTDNQPRPEERALARVSKDGHKRDRASGHPSRRRFAPPQDEVCEFELHPPDPIGSMESDH